MHAHQHTHEKHLSSTDLIRDVVIGMADGLTVPFALAAGLSGAVSTPHLVVVAGMAEIVAGAIAMGLGGYLAAHTDSEHYATEFRREQIEVERIPHVERQEIKDIFAGYGLTGSTLEAAADAITSDKQRWIDFMMRHELGLEKPNPHRALTSGGTIGLSYIVGGMIPLFSYMICTDIHQALIYSAVLTGFALAVFGGIKARLTGISPVRGAFQTLLVGGLAAALAYALARLIA